MNTSETLTKLLPAFAAAKKVFGPVLKDANNPAFRSKYATLASAIDACDEALLANGLILIQPPETLDGLVINTRLYHTSGEYIETSLTVPTVAAPPQSLGSSITYGRRYALLGLMGQAPEDDDGNAGSGQPTEYKMAAEQRAKIAQQTMEARKAAPQIKPVPAKPQPGQTQLEADLGFNESDIPQSFSQESDDWATAIADMETADDFNRVLAQIKKADVSIQLMASTKAKKLGFIYDKDKMKYMEPTGTSR